MFKICILSALLLSLVSCQESFKSMPNIDQSELKRLEEARSYFSPIPSFIIDKTEQTDKISLGKKLYFEKKLSINNTISCSSCHNLDTFGVDNQKTSPGHDGTRGDRNSPTVLNAALHIAQFWDGRAADVEAQALGPILNPIEHGLASEADALAKIDTLEYRRAFHRAFKGEDKPFNYTNIGRAIGAFERTLLTPSRFDDYLKGSLFALTNKEKKGLDKFISIGCVSCHNGVAVGGQMYMKLGAVKDYPVKDKGRFMVTQDEGDLFVFKVPSLRNVHHTQPYLHDGSINDLGQMIKVMAEYQLGEDINSSDIEYIKAFLGAL